MPTVTCFCVRRCLLHGDLTQWHIKFHTEHYLCSFKIMWKQIHYLIITSSKINTNNIIWGKTFSPGCRHVMLFAASSLSWDLWVSFSILRSSRDCMSHVGFNWYRHIFSAVYIKHFCGGFQYKMYDAEAKKYASQGHIYGRGYFLSAPPNFPSPSQTPGPPCFVPGSWLVLLLSSCMCDMGTAQKHNKRGDK